MSKPSEKYLLTQRLFTFFDEWLFYALLIYLYVNGYTLFIPAILIGGPMIAYSYYRLWKMEDEVFSDA